MWEVCQDLLNLPGMDGKSDKNWARLGMPGMDGTPTMPDKSMIDESAGFVKIAWHGWPLCHT